MPLKKLPFKPGINRENTRYTTEGGWYECDKIRFRQGMPEKIGGWTQATTDTFLGVCRSLHSWFTLGGQALRGLGTHLKYYVEEGGAYNDITPIRETTAAGDVTFSASTGSNTITVTDTGSNATKGSYVTFSGAVSLGGNITAAILNIEYSITSVTSADEYTVTASVAANSSDTGNGGASVVGEYQLNVGEEITTAASGWGAGPWGAGPWGTGTTGADLIRIWNHTNFGEDLIYGPRGGEIYYWDYTTGTSTRGVALSTLSGASDTPVIHTHLLVSDTSRFVFAFGCNELGSADLDPLLIRWSDQEDAANWTPAATNQSGSLRLSRGSGIVAVQQARQEILVWTDTTLYSLQYLGPPVVWSSQVVGENISIVSNRAVSYASGVAYWMGSGVFYAYDGHVIPLVCDLRRHVFSDINEEQDGQIFSGTNEAFHELWWFYCSDGSTTVDSYVIFNYRERIWYYGTLARTAWRDDAWSGLPLAATYNNKLVTHEVGIDDNEADDAAAIEAYITSSQFDIGDGHNFAFIRRIMPDITFAGSTVGEPCVTMTLTPLKGSGSGYKATPSEGGVNTAETCRSVSTPVEEYTDQLRIRVRGRQLELKIESSDIGVNWQLGAPRIDIRPDGRR